MTDANVRVAERPVSPEEVDMTFGAETASIGNTMIPSHELKVTRYLNTTFTTQCHVTVAFYPFQESE